MRQGSGRAEPEMASQLAPALRADASLLAQQIDVAADQLLLVRLTEDEYRAASFLDQRILTRQSPAQWAPWHEVEAAGIAERPGLGFIFHIGHSGSTLVSRLLDEVPNVLGVREPQLLRTLAELGMLRGRAESPWPPERFDERTATVCSLLSRSFRDGQRAIVKPTSFVSEIAADLLGAQRRGLVLTLSPERYIETILGGENSRRELAMMAGARLVRLHRRLGAEPWKLWELDEAQRAALSWACETAALEAAAAERPDQLMWIDFDTFLAAPAEWLARGARFLGLDLAAEESRKLVDGPVMGRYSKAPEHAYGPELRRQVLEQARREHGAAIAGAMRWLEAAAGEHETIGRAMARRAE